MNPEKMLAEISALKGELAKVDAAVPPIAHQEAKLRQAFAIASEGPMDHLVAMAVDVLVRDASTSEIISTHPELAKQRVYSLALAGVRDEVIEGALAEAAEHKNVLRLTADVREAKSTKLRRQLYALELAFVAEHGFDVAKQHEINPAALLQVPAQVAIDAGLI